MTIKIGDKIKVIDQDIVGYVVDMYDNKIVIEDDCAETEDNTLEFKLSEIEEVNAQ
jgi:hypothetical protein